MTPAPAEGAPSRSAHHRHLEQARAQVIELLGRPAAERSSNGFTYLFYINGCERTCGMNDLVTLRGDPGMDWLDTSIRHAAGQALSPRPVTPTIENTWPTPLGSARRDVRPIAQR